VGITVGNKGLNDIKEEYDQIKENENMK